MKFVKNSLGFWIKKFPIKNNKSHKYSRCQLVVVSGEKKMIGATILSTEAALRTGVGSVKVLCSRQNFKIFALKFPSLLKKEINHFNDFLKQRKETEIAIIGHNSFIGRYKDNEIGLLEHGKEELLHCYPYKVDFAL